MIGGLDLFQGSVPIILLVRAGKIAAVEFRIVFLLAMIRQRLTGNLPAGNAAAISETRDEQGVNAGILLKPIQSWLNTFVDKRYGSHLDTDCSAGDLLPLRKTRGDADSTNHFCKISSRELTHCVTTLVGAGAALNRSYKRPARLSIFLSFTSIWRKESTLQAWGLEIRTFVGNEIPDSPVCGQTTRCPS